MTAETVLTLIAGLIGGGAGTQIIQWLRYRNQDSAAAAKTIHDSTSQALTVSTTLLAQWIQDASTAQQKIAELARENGSKDIELREALHAINLCRDSLNKCRERHGCGE